MTDRHERRGRERTTRGSFLFALALLPILGAVLALVIDGPLPANNEQLQISLGLGALAWLVAVGLAAKGHGDLRFAVGGAIALRLLMLVGEPSLSDDVYRYVWEGELLANGTSPYAHAPASPELADVRERLPEVAARINNPDVSAAYPPVAQYAFALVEMVARRGVADPDVVGPFFMRVFFALCDLLVLVPLVGLLRRAGRPAALAVTWAWCPLVVLEFAGSGHLDSLGILLLLAAILLVSGPREARLRPDEWMGVCLLSGAVFVKYLPLVALPFVLRTRGVWRRVLWLLMFALLAYLPLLVITADVRGLWAGLARYGREWEGGSLVFRWIDDAVRALPSTPSSDPRLIARGITLLIWLVVAVFAWRRRLDVVQGTGLLLGAYLVLTPTLHPWYLTWIVPFVALRPGLAWPALLAAAPVLYWPLAQFQAIGVWEEPTWLWYAVAPPFLLLLAFDAVRRRRVEPAPLPLAAT